MAPAPYTPATAVRTNSPPIEVLIGVGFVAVVIMALVAAASSAGGADDAPDHDAEATRALAAKLEAAAQEADAHIARHLAKLDRNSGGPS